jgi:hypothetical protein
MKTKKFWQSRSVQGVILAALALAIRFAATKGWLGMDLAEVINSYVLEVCDTLGFGGLCYALYGRAVTNGEKLTI